MRNLSASNAKMLMACHASGNLEVAIPNWVEPPRNDRAGAKSKGTMLHEVLATMVGFSYWTERVDENGAVVPSRQYKNTARDLINMAEVLLKVAAIWKERRWKVLVEHTVKTVWLPKVGETTADLVFYVADEMVVIDLKGGKIPVDALDNEQLMFYANTYRQQYSPKAKKIRLLIMQPWSNDPNLAFSEWEITADALDAFEADAIAAQEAILAGDTTFQVGEHCTFCPANPHSRGDKAMPYCPEMLITLGYGPTGVDEDAMLREE